MNILKSLEYPDIDHDAVSGLPVRPEPAHCSDHRQFEYDCLDCQGTIPEPSTKGREPQLNEVARRRQQRTWQEIAADEAGVPEFGPI